MTVKEYADKVFAVNFNEGGKNSLAELTIDSYCGKLCKAILDKADEMLIVCAEGDIDSANAALEKLVLRQMEIIFYG